MELKNKASEIALKDTKNWIQLLPKNSLIGIIKGEIDMTKMASEELGARICNIDNKHVGTD